MINKIVATTVLFVLLLAPGTASPARVQYKIVTASPTGTYIKIGMDLAKHVAGDADIDLQVLPSKGSVDNVERLRHEPDVKLALVQSDVFKWYLQAAAAGNKKAGELIAPLRAIMPLYDEEIYFVVRADAPMTYIHDIKNKTLSVGPLGSGPALSAPTVYELMFEEPLPEARRQYLGNDDALRKLTVDKTIDVAVFVAGQPATLFSDMKPEAAKYIKLLRLDDRAPETARAKKTYFPATVRAKSYESWLKEDVPTLTVKAYLVTYDYRLQTRTHLVKFADFLCKNFAQLKEKGHAKWQEVRLEFPPLGEGWSYFEPMTERLRKCGQPPPCTPQEIALRICPTSPGDAKPRAK